MDRKKDGKLPPPNEMNTPDFEEVGIKIKAPNESEEMKGIENTGFDSDEDEEMLTMATELENNNQGIITSQNTVIREVEKVDEESNLHLTEDSVESMSSSSIEMEDEDRPSQIMRPSQSQTMHLDSESATSLSDSDEGHTDNTNNDRLNMEPQPSTSRQIPSRVPAPFRPIPSRPRSKAVEEEAGIINNLAYARAICSFIYNCKTLKKKSRLPLQPIQDKADWENLAKFTPHCLVPQERQDVEVLNRFLGDGMEWITMFDNIVRLNKTENNLDGLYKYFTFQVEDELRTSVTIEAQQRGFLDVLIRETLNQRPISKVPSHLWVNVIRPHNELFLIDAENFKLMDTISDSNLNQTAWDLKGAIVREKEEFHSIVLSSDKSEGFRCYDNEGRPTPTRNNIETWKDILYNASSLLYMTNDVECSEVYESGMVRDFFIEEELMGSGADVNKDDLGSNDKEFKRYDKRMIRIEDKIYSEIKEKLDLRTKLMKDFEDEVFQRIKSLVDTHYARHIVSRNMQKKEMEEVWNFFKNQKTDIDIIVENNSYTVYPVNDKSTRSLCLRESRSNRMKWAFMCKKCLRKGMDAEVPYCYEHVQAKAVRLFILHSTQVEDCKEVILEVVDPTVVFNAQKRYNLLTDIAKKTLKYGSKFFKCPHKMKPDDIVTVNGYKEAEELSFAMDIWNWLKFRFVLQHSGSYFKHQLSPKGMTNLKDLDMKEVGQKLRNLAKSEGYMMEIVQKRQEDDSFIEETSRRYGIWMVRDRTIPMHPTHRTSIYCLSGVNNSTYWGTNRGKTASAYYHVDLSREQFIVDIGKEIGAECCFTTFCENTGRMMEATIQLVSVLASMFSVKRLSDQAVPVHLNSKIETFNIISNDIDCSTLMELLSLKEFGVKFNFKKRMEM